jgi:transcriptional regulator with XRE-family HTH domain
VNRFSPSRLRAALQESGMNQAELARKMGVSRAALCRILRGHRSPNSRFIAALKQGFPNLPLEYFFEISPPKEERSGRNPVDSRNHRA